MASAFLSTRDRKRGSKLDAARFIRLEDYVHALVTRRCGEFIACRVKASKTVSVLPGKGFLNCCKNVIVGNFDRSQKSNCVNRKLVNMFAIRSSIPFWGRGGFFDC